MCTKCTAICHAANRACHNRAGFHVVHMILSELVQRRGVGLNCETIHPVSIEGPCPHDVGNPICYNDGCGLHIWQLVTVQSLSLFLVIVLKEPVLLVINSERWLENTRPC
jgi:hypothetical protein